MAINHVRHIKRALGANGILLLIIAAVMLEGISMIQYHYAREEISVDLHLRAQSELLAKSLAIQNIMSQVESAVDNHVWDAERLINYSDSSFAVVKRIVEQNPEIIGSSFSFKPNYYPERGYWFESYAVRRDSDEIVTMQLGSKDHDYTQMEFYKIPIEADTSRWTDPYLDSEGARMMLTTYSQPVHDSTGKPVAILDADVSLDWLKNVLSVNYVYPSSYHILISRSGQLMSYPNSEYIMNKTLADIASEVGDPVFARINEDMLAGESGNAVFKDNDGEKYHVFFSPVGGETGWSLAVVSSEKEIFGHYNRMRDTLLTLRFLALLILIFIIFRSVRNINKLEKVTVERERITSELKIAGEIQAGMLPKNDVLKTSDEKIDVAGMLDSAKEVGGDLYDYFVKNDHLYFCIGDVSGKGVPASMFMTVTRSLFRTVAPYTFSAAKVLSYMNRTLVDLNESNMFVTFFVGILNLKTGQLKYANAGHDGPVIIDSTGVRVLDVLPNLPLGVFPDFAFVEQKSELLQDSLMFLYTDGLTEAMNRSRQEFGASRMLDSIKEICSVQPDISPKELLNLIVGKVKDFVNKAEQSDDLTMLSFRFIKKDEGMIERKITLINELSSIRQLNDFIEAVCTDAGIPQELSMEIKLAVEEAVVNVIDYAYESGTTGKIEVSMKINRDDVKIEISDRGKEFDPTLVEEADINAAADERPIGGLGIFLIRQLADNVSYRRENDRNILIIEKNIRINNNNENSDENDNY